MMGNQELEIQLKEVAQWVTEKKLNSPAIFLLEAHKPLMGLGSVLVQISQPLLSLLFGSKNIELMMKVLEEPKSVDSLIDLIESGAKQSV